MLCRSMMEAGLTREGLVVALGGGILTDMAGFAASIYKRGVRYLNVPTTLLAQVDAGLGGKTGVNFDSYKNMLGVIRQPQLTFLCPEVLRTLPERDFRSGAAELLKTFLLADATLYGKAVACLSAPERPDLGALIFEAARIKAEIVARDPFESGERRKLNLGHTFAHAIEHEAQSRGEDITHGEAVAMGLLLAARLSDALGVSESPLAERLSADMAACGLRADCPYPMASLAAAMTRDKKAGADGRVRFILLRRIGEAVEFPLDPDELIDKL
jgi:3-dehydroquinate synthetase